MKTSFKELKTRNILSKEQMQKVQGGGTCKALVPMPQYVTDVDGYFNKNNDLVQARLSKETAIEIAAKYGGHWCCDSCDNASWT